MGSFNFFDYIDLHESFIFLRESATALYFDYLRFFPSFGLQGLFMFFLDNSTLDLSSSSNDLHESLIFFLDSSTTLDFGYFRLSASIDLHKFLMFFADNSSTLCLDYLRFLLYIDLHEPFISFFDDPTSIGLTYFLFLTEVISLPFLKLFIYLWLYFVFLALLSTLETFLFSFSYLIIFRSLLLVFKFFLRFAIDFFLSLVLSAEWSWDYNLILLDLASLILGFMNDAYDCYSVCSLIYFVLLVTGWLAYLFLLVFWYSLI